MRVFAAVLWLLVAAAACAEPPAALVVDDAGTLYFTDAHSGSLWERAPDGRLARLARDIHPHHLWLDREGAALYGERRSWSAAKGHFEIHVWRLGRGGSLEPVAAVPEGLRWTRDAEGAQYRSDGERIHVVRPSGSRVLGGDPFAGRSHPHNGLGGLALAADGSLYVADADHRCVWQVRRDGSVHLVYSSGRPWAPTAVAVAGPAVYVLEGRPDGPASLLGYWQGARVLRIEAGRTVVWAVVEERREVLLGAGAGLMLLGVAGVIGLARRRRQAAPPAG